MKYFIIAGEASGDLHASQLMKAIKERDQAAEFCFFGGDMMSSVGGVRLKHYKEVAYMGFIPVILHLPTILTAMRICKRTIMRWQPDVVILVDYPGFNLSIANFVHRRTKIPVFYYIAPKIWAWKEHRIEFIKRDVTALFSILPFEISFFEKKHHYPIHYVGNPTVDEVNQFRTTHQETFATFCKSNSLEEKPIIALLAGSRKQEIRDNLIRMCCAARTFVERGYQLVLAAAPSIPMSFYDHYIAEWPEGSRIPLTILQNQTYRILQQAEVAIVTSGTATLETALFRVPQVVCYYTAFGKLISLLRQFFLKVKYVSLVNLIVDYEVVPELVAEEMTISNVRTALETIIKGGKRREAMLAGYEQMANELGPTGASARAAEEMIRLMC